MNVTTVLIDSIGPNARNYRGHPQAQIDRIKTALGKWGQYKNIVVSGSTIVAGHGVWEAARQLGWTEIAVVDMVDLPLPEQAALLAWDNEASRGAIDDDAALAALVADLHTQDEALAALAAGTDERLAALLASVRDGPGLGDGVQHQSLSDRFIVPPMSVLDVRQGYWQERKRAWLSLGIQSELGRGDNALDMSASMVGITDEQERAACSTQRRESPRRRANAEPGGSRRDAANLGPDGHTVRGDGHGRPVNAERERERERVAPRMAMHNDPMQRKARYDASSTPDASGKT